MALTVNSLLARMRGAERVRMKDGFLHVTFPALGTTNDVQFRAPGEREAGAFLEDMFAWLAAFEARYSRFIPDSLISRINDAAGRHAVAVDEADEELFGLCDYHHARTRGAFDPTMGPLVLLWSGDAETWVPVFQALNLPLALWPRF